MADILVQNAVVEIAKAIGESADGINYTTIVGQNMDNIRLIKNKKAGHR